MARFEWDEGKNQINQAKHGLRFELAVEVFDDPMAVSVLDREVDGEQRWQTIGLVRDIHLLLVAHTLREEDGDEVIRLVSARRAIRSERRIYEEG